MDIDTTLPTKIDVDAQIAKLAKRYRRAGGLGMSVLNLVGGSAENLIDQLPHGIRRNLESTTIAALNQAMKAAHSSRSYVPDQKGWLNQVVTASLGAAGGAGGLPTALAELPVT
ncbi:MAG: protein EcsC, partial [Pseudomonadota bacterium]